MIGSDLGCLGFLNVFGLALRDEMRNGDGVYSSGRRWNREALVLVQ